MAETNGIAEITVGGEKIPLLFGRAAAQEMSNRSIENLSGNEIKLLTDLVYSGMLNHAIANDFPFPKYNETYSLVERFADEENAFEQQESIWETFQASRWGSEWAKAIEGAKKKVEELQKAIEQSETPSQ